MIDDTWHRTNRSRTPRHGHGKRWQVRWRDPAGRQRKKSFATKDEAVAFDAQLTVNPKLKERSATVADLKPLWWDTKAGLTPATRHSYTAAWAHVADQWADARVADITPEQVLAWRGKLTAASPSVARRATLVLQQIVSASPHVDPRVLRIKAGRQVRRDVEPLTRDQVAFLAEETGVADEVWTLAATGIRFGELVGARVRDVDKRRKLLRVRRQILEAGGQTPALPKNKQPRDIPVPGWLIKRWDLDRDGDAPLLPGPRGGMWWRGTWTRRWDTARQRLVGRTDVVTHDLRHTYACWNIEAGVDLRTLQMVMGHKDLSTTVDLYGRFARDRVAGLRNVVAEP